MLSDSERTKITEILSNRNTRIPFCEHSLYWFGWYYFNKYFHVPSAKFHVEMAGDLQFDSTFKYLILEAFRDSAKTSWLKIAFVHKIVYRLKNFLCYTCSEKIRARSNLYDIAIELQTNKKLLEDFGQVFFDPIGGEKKSKLKRLEEFVTTTGIKVLALGTGQTTRGLIHGPHRPDFHGLDDFENDKTKRSQAKTEEVRRFIDELMSGISSSANIAFLCNKISNTGSVKTLESKANKNKDWKLSRIDLIQNDEIMWKSKFVWSDVRARMINSDVKDSRKVFSIEERKRTLGTRRFNQEYLNIPIPDDESIIKHDWVFNKFYTRMPHGHLRKIIMMDPQAGEKESADNYAICVLGYLKGDSHRYVLEMIKGKASKLKQTKKFIETCLRHRDHLQLCGVEKILSQVAVFQYVMDWRAGRVQIEGLEEKDRNLPFIEVSPQGKDKVARLEMHEASFERGEVHLHHTMLDFAENLCLFPDVAHDDDIDALIYCLEYSYRTTTFAKTEPMRDNIRQKGVATMGNIEKEQF